MRKRIIGKAHELRCTSVRGIAAKSQLFSAKRTAGRSHIRTQARRGSSQSSRASRTPTSCSQVRGGSIRPRAELYVRGPENSLNPRVPNLVLFLEIGVCVDAARWLVHVRRGDYSRWFEDVIRDRGLAEDPGPSRRNALMTLTPIRAMGLLSNNRPSLASTGPVKARAGMLAAKKNRGDHGAFREASSTGYEIIRRLAIRIDWNSGCSRVAPMTQINRSLRRR